MKFSAKHLKTVVLGAALISGAATAASYQYRVPSVGVRLVDQGMSTPSAPSSAIGALTADTSPNFGSVALNSSASRSFTFTNSGTAAATGVYVGIPAVTGLALSSNSCGTSAAPVSVAAGSSCSIALTYGGGTASSLSGSNLQVTGAFSGSPASSALSGNLGGFDAAGAWSSAYNATTAPTASNLSFGIKTTNTTPVLKTFYVRNTGTMGGINGGVSMAFSLTGDTAHFKLKTVQMVSTSNGATAACRIGGAVAGDGLSSTECTTNGPDYNAYTVIQFQVQYAPTAVGDHSVTLVPQTSNGTVLPTPLVFTGRGEFNPAGVWSTAYASTTAPTSSTLSYGIKTVSATPVTKTFYVRNTGTNGGLTTGFVLSGDTAYFKLKTVRMISTSNGATGACTAGGVVAADGLSSTECTVNGPDYNTYTVIQLQVDYTPSAVGNYSATITPVTSNTTVLPGAITLTGTGQ